MDLGKYQISKTTLTLLQFKLTLFKNLFYTKANYSQLSHKRCNSS